MHYLVAVMVQEPTRAALDAAMAPFNSELAPEGDGHWDWYRAGGRWDGWLQGDAEQERRRTHSGFNFDKRNNDVSRNCITCRGFGNLSRDLPYAFVADGRWLERRRWVPELGHFVDTPDYEEQFRAVLAAHPDHWLVAVDAHD